MKLLTSAAAIAAALSYIGVTLVRRWGEHRQVLDIPNERSSHSRPVARGGGLAIALVVLAGLILFQALERLAEWRTIMLFLIASAGVAAVSWLDDLRGVPALIRFTVHLTAAIMLIGAFGPVRSIRLGDTTAQLGVLASPLLIVWIVGLTNAFNFMDGIDGIAGQQAVAAAAGWLLVTRGHSVPLISAIAVLILGAAAGFLWQNWQPARIFMGDVGSAFLGLVFASLPLAWHDGQTLLIAAFLLWPFIYDTSFTLIRRLTMRERIFSPHRSHLYQRLTIAGYSHRAVASFYFGLAISGIAAAEAARRGHDLEALLVILILAAMLTKAVYVVESRARRAAAEGARAAPD